MNRENIFTEIKEYHNKSEDYRSRLIAESDTALRLSKQAIFALHRDDVQQAKDRLSEADEVFLQAKGMIDEIPKLNYQGARRAALEEYVEARLFLDYVEGGDFGEVPEYARRPDAYLAGLADFSGELVRLATRKATDGEYAAVDTATEAVAEIVAFLLELNLRGHVRKKADQAKRNLRKLEDMRYEIGLRKA